VLFLLDYESVASSAAAPSVLCHLRDTAAAQLATPPLVAVFQLSLLFGEMREIGKAGVCSPCFACIAPIVG